MMPDVDALSLRIAALITDRFDQIAGEYDFSKYPLAEYEEFKRTFAAIAIDNASIAAAMRWKWGHWGKDNVPRHHQNLIREIQVGWKVFAVDTARESPEATFDWWMKYLGRSTVFITVAFIVHLVHHKSHLPIIDQHNFRAMNALRQVVVPSLRVKKRPSQWADVLDLQDFIRALLSYMPTRDFQQVDRFLMMFGRNHVARARRNRLKPVRQL